MTTRNGTAYGMGYERRRMTEMIEALGALDPTPTVLVDVRATNRSRRADADGPAVRRSCEREGVEYQHRPRLGIPKAERAFLHRAGHYSGLREPGKQSDTASELEALLNAYEARIRDEHDAQSNPDLRALLELLKGGRSVALLCYERNPAECHRTRLGAVLADAGYSYVELNQS